MTRTQYIAGVDEVGRGPIAGPVAVCTVAVPSDLSLSEIFPGLTDSKKMTACARERIVARFSHEPISPSHSFYSYKESNIRAAVVFTPAAYIDMHGIEAAIRVSLDASIESLNIPLDTFIYLDGRLRAPAEYQQETVIRGDSIIPAISLASVIAKVARDTLMKRVHEHYPEYGFARHKGYGTAVHYVALAEKGTCPEHRKSFMKGLYK